MACRDGLTETKPARSLRSVQPTGQPVKIVVRAAGYLPFEKDVTIAGDQTVDVVMTKRETASTAPTTTATPTKPTATPTKPTKPTPTATPTKPEPTKPPPHKPKKPKIEL